MKRALIIIAICFYALFGINATDISENEIFDYFNSVTTSKAIGPRNFNLYWIKGNSIVIKESKTTLAKQECISYEISSKGNKNSEYVSPFFSLYAILYYFPEGYKEDVLSKSDLIEMVANQTKSIQDENIEIISYADYRETGLNLIDLVLAQPLDYGYSLYQETLVTEYEGEFLIMNIQYLVSDYYTTDDALLATLLGPTNLSQDTDWIRTI